MKNWYQVTVPETLEKLETNPKDGLSSEEVSRRQAKYGLNELVDRGMKSPWKILWEQLTGIMVVILMISAVISILLQEYKDAIVILVIVVLNAILGFTQEYRAEQAMAALKKMAVPKVKVRRNGHLVEMPAQQLVPGDIVQLDAGDAVPADARLIEAINLRVQEAVLTGESEPVEKNTDAIASENASLGDRYNLVYMGTVTTYGRGLAVVTNTGMNTELGKIADLIQSVGSESTPLQRRLEQLGRGLAIAALGIVAVVFALGVLRGEPVRIMFQTAISMAVAAVPEGLAAVVTIALALGSQRMLQRRALIRKLPAVETLGSVTVICSDKTGTLTENKMTVTVVDVAGNKLNFLEEVRSFTPLLSAEEIAHPILVQEPAVAMMLAGGALCNDAILEKSDDNSGYSSVGDPTEGALVIAAARTGLMKADLEKAMPRVAELPFDSDRKRMTTIHETRPELLPEVLEKQYHSMPSLANQPYIAITKGAVDGLLEVCDRVWFNGHEEKIDVSWRERIVEANNAMAQNGMRVLGVAYQIRQSAQIKDTDQPVEQNLVLLGMVGMIDPARPEVKDAVHTAQTAGIRPIMITGDHPLTALHIAKDLGITRQGRVITGQDLENMSVDTLKDQLEDASVFARVSPEHKLKIVQALQDKGQIVAMTGDGVNDAPALKKADIGVAMGITGTDVSKEASDMVLLDDNFATIVAAVEEGRRIYDNIRKFVKYAVTSNAGEIWVMLAGPFLGLHLPLTPLQILWVNLVTDGLPGLALTVEPAEKNTMLRKPHSPNENIFDRGMARDIIWIGLLLGSVSLASGLWAINTGRTETWQTMIFTTLTFAQMGNVLALRSDWYSLFQIGLKTNMPLLGAVILTILLQFAVIYLPFLQNVFGTVALPLVDLLVSLAMSTAVFIGIEIFKIFMRRKTAG